VLKPHHSQVSLRALLALPIALAFGGCSSSMFSSDAGWFSKPVEITSRPSWLFYSDGREQSKAKPIGPEDLVAADGSCAAAEAAPAVASAEPGASGEAASAPAPAPIAPSAIGLDMTECEVVRRAGHTSSIEVGNNARGERSVVMTYMSGPSPGIYRFTAGRLTSIQRVAEPEPPPKTKKPARSQQNRARS
jgi:hypothetical protein